MGKTTRMLALVLLTVMAVGGFVVCKGEISKAYASEQTALAEKTSINHATSGDGRIDASKFSATLSKKTLTYDGSEKKPAVKVLDNSDRKLKEGTDYICSYENNIYPGTAALVVSYIGRYKGTITLSFKITEAAMSNVSSAQTANKITLKWKSLKGAAKYKLQRYSNGKWIVEYAGKNTSAAVEKLKANTVYKFRLEAYVVHNGKEVVVASTNTITEYTNPGKITGGVSGVPYKKNKKVIESSESNSAVIGWDIVKGAEGYIIYQYNPETKKWNECLEYYSTSYDGADKNKEYYTVYRLKPATGYMFKVAAYKTHNNKMYIGEKSDVIKSATSPINKYGYDDCYVLKTGTHKRSKYFRVEMEGCSSNIGYYIVRAKTYTKSGRQVIESTMKTNKNICMVATSENTEDYYYLLFVHPYYKYDGKLYVNRYDGGGTMEGNIRTSISKLAGITQNYVSRDGKYRKEYHQEIYKSKTGKVVSYNVIITTMKKIGANEYRIENLVTKKYNSKMQYTGMEKEVYDKYDSTYYYNSKNKLVKYIKNVYSKNGVYLGYNIYDAKGRVIKKARY